MQEEIQYFKDTLVKEQGYEDLEQNVSTDFSEESNENKCFAEVMSYIKTINYIRDVIDRLKDFGYSEALSLKMLVKCNWNITKAMDRISQELNTLTIEDKLEFECVKCNQKDKIENAHSLDCNHSFCKPCFSAFLGLTIKEKTLLKFCPFEGCCEVISLEHYEKHLKSGLEEYEMLVFENFISSQDNLTLIKCPRNGCSMALKSPNLYHNNNSEPITISCECGYSFCSHCYEVPHKRLTCQKYSEWLSKLPDICKNEEWIQQNTKKCPKCSERCLREEGEQFVECLSCNAKFCWVCSDFFNTHGFMCGEALSGLDNKQYSSPQQFKQLLEENEKSFEKKVYALNCLNRQHGQHISEAIDTITEIRGEIAMTYVIEYYCNVDDGYREYLEEFRNPICKTLYDFDEYLYQLLCLGGNNVNESMKNWREELIVRSNSLKCLSNSLFELFENFQCNYQME